MAPLRRSYDANHSHFVTASTYFAAPASLIPFASSGKPALSPFAFPAANGSERSEEAQGKLREWVYHLYGQPARIGRSHYKANVCATP